MKQNPSAAVPSWRGQNAYRPSLLVAAAAIAGAVAWWVALSCYAGNIVWFW